MYCDYYGFREKPFNITPDPGFIFLSAHHKEAFAHLLYGIDNHAGFISLTGEIGTGKTTVIRTLMNQLTPDRYRTALVFNPCLSSLGLMQHINREYGLPCGHPDTADLLHELNLFLLTENAAERTVVLVIDEAQNLAPAVLEQVRLISNLETERDKLIQIVLVGQPELRDLLHRQELRQLGQRIGVSYHLSPMDLADTGDYIIHRLDVAGRRDNNLFSAGAIKKIFRFSGGYPRLINLACDRALLLGYSKEQTVITPAMAAAACADVSHAEKGRSPRRRLMPVGVALLVLLAAGGMYLLTTKSTTNKAAPEQAAMPADLSGAAGAELLSETETGSAVRAFNSLAELWRVAPLQYPPLRPATTEAIARQRGLELLRFSGNLGTLLRLDTPALLELTLSGAGGKRYLALTGSSNGRVIVAPPLLGRTTLSGAELESIWSGHALLLWKNYLDIPPGIKTGARGESISRLQGLLRDAGAYAGAATTTFDRNTETAVKAFQASRGLEQSGIVGRQTLHLLYRSAGGFTPPTLTHQETHK
jgi:general secretion pathway protein A